MNKVKGFVLFLGLVFSVAGLAAQTQQWLWAKSTGSAVDDYGYKIDTDTAGNSYITGTFAHSVGFGNTTLSTLNTVGTTTFIAKMSRTGNWLWAKKLENNHINGVYPNDIVVDSGGNSYVTVTYSSYLEVGGNTHYSMGDSDFVVAKLDQNGNWMWSVNVGSSSYEYCKSMAVDSANNLCLIGEFHSALTIGNTQLTYGGWGSEMFIAKMDCNGNWLWATQSGRTCSVWGTSIVVDGYDNIYACGEKDLNSTAYFGSYAIVGNIRSYIVKLDVSGNFVRAQGLNVNIGDIASVVDNDGNSILYVIGVFTGTVYFDTITLTSSGNYDAYVLRINDDASIAWAKKAGGSGDDNPSSLAIDSESNVYISGWFNSVASFGTFNITSSGMADIFIAKIDDAGNWILADKAGGPPYDTSYGISIDAMDNLYITGCFANTSYFGNLTISSFGGYDILVAKYGYPQIEASFTASPLTGIQPLPVQFTDQSQQGSGPIVSWLWDFGDGNTSNLQNPTHTYYDAGIFDVNLTVTNSSDSTSTLVRENYITVIDDEASILLQTSDHMNFGSIYIEEFSAVQTLTFTNNGSQPLTFTSSHLMCSPANFQYQIPGWDYTWDPGETGYIYIRFAPVEIGAIEDTLVIVNNSANHPILKITLTGTGLHVPLQPPQNVQIAMNGNDAVISWDAVTHNTHNQPITPDYYLVFYNGSSDPENGLYYYHGASNTLSYTHYLVGLHADYMFYRVVAYKYYGRGALDLAALGLEPGMRDEQVYLILNQ